MSQQNPGTAVRPHGWRIAERRNHVSACGGSATTTRLRNAGRVITSAARSCVARICWRLRDDFADAVLAGIENEPQHRSGRSGRLLQWVSGGAIAASVAVVALMFSAPREQGAERDRAAVGCCPCQLESAGSVAGRRDIERVPAATAFAGARRAAGVGEQRRLRDAGHADGSASAVLSDPPLRCCRQCRPIRADALCAADRADPAAGGCRTAGCGEALRSDASPFVGIGVPPSRDHEQCIGAWIVIGLAVVPGPERIRAVH